MTLTSIITVNFNQPLITIEFLNSIKNYCKNDNIELILVDNGSDEDYELNFKETFPEIKYIYSKKNLGFAGGNNLGIQIAKGDFLLFLNNDTEISENFVETLINEFYHNPDIGILSP